MDDGDSQSSASSNAGDGQHNERLTKLKDIVRGQRHIFACGGAVPIQDSDDRTAKVSKPVTIRWDTVSNEAQNRGSPCSKLTLPLKGTASTANLASLVASLQPATFGRDGQDGYDGSYRKALAMDPTAFCTTFDPYSMGIIDEVAQFLLPNVIDSPLDRSIRAELHKLNIHTGPSGNFRPHVDTPTSPLQFGSLVVCLPVEHKGGNLDVRHEGEQVTFSWGTDRDGRGMEQDNARRASIYWAAFYSDCEREVQEIQSGHRLTLTYNLYAVCGAGRLVGSISTLTPADLPLYQAIEPILNNDFLSHLFGPQGGTLGFWCSHAYAYNEKIENPLPQTLKGTDAMLWETLRALGLDPRVAPVMKMRRTLREVIEYNCQPQSPLFEADSDDSNDSEESPPQYWKGMPSKMPSQWIVGRDFGLKVKGPFPLDHYSADELNMLEEWGCVDYSRRPIYWLTRPKEPQPQLLYPIVSALMDVSADGKAYTKIGKR